MTLLEKSDFNGSPYDGFDIPLAPEPLEPWKKNPEEWVKKPETVTMKLDTLALESKARIEMTKSSLVARSEILRAGKDDKAFPITFKDGVELSNIPSTFWGSSFDTKVTPDFITGENKVAAAGRDSYDTSYDFGNLQRNIQKYEKQYDDAGKGFEELFIPISENNRQYSEATGRNYYEVMNTAWEEKGIEAHFDQVLQRTIFVAIDPKYSDLVAIENKNQIYFSEKASEYARFNDMSQEATKILWKWYDEGFGEPGLLQKVPVYKEALVKAQEELQKAVEKRFLYSDLASKSGEYQKTFREVFHKEYSEKDIEQHYKNAVNVYGGLLFELKWGQNTPDDQFKSIIMSAGKNLTTEEKIIFIGLLNSELERNTYNTWAYKAQKSPEAVLLKDQFKNLANATYSGKQAPMSVCTGISSAAAQVANIWDIPAGTVTVGWDDTGHAITIMKIGDRTVFSDYGRVSTGRNIEEALDSYGIHEKNLVFINYLADENGNIVGAIRTPLNKHLDAQMFSMRDVALWIKNPSSMPEGLEVEITNQGKSVTLTNKFGESFYTKLGLTESKIGNIKLQTVSTVIGAEGGDASFRYFIEGNISKTDAKFTDGTKKEYLGLGIQGSMVKSWKASDNLTFDTSASVQAKGQTSGQSDNSIGGLWGGQTGHISATVGAEARYRANEHTILHTGISHTRTGVPNLQSNLAEIRSSYTSKTVSQWIEHTRDNGTVIAGQWSKMRTPISETTRIEGSFKWDLSASGYYEKLKWKHILGPTDTSTVGMQVAGKIHAFKNTSWSTWVESSKIGNLERDNKAKFTINKQF